MSHRKTASVTPGTRAVNKHFGRPTHGYGRRLHVEALEERKLLSATPYRLEVATGDSSSPQDIVDVGGTAFFTAYDPTYGNAGSGGRELWKSDGTEAGTVLVKDINPGGTGSIFSSGPNLTSVGGTLFFAATDGTSGTELWKSDGTEAGTVLVKDIWTGFYTSDPRSLTNVNGTLFFTVVDGTNGRELWKSDGTESGTVLVKDIRPGGDGSFDNYSSANLTNVSGTLFFTANDGTSGTELWKSDGTEAGTVLVKDVAPGTHGYQGPYQYYGPYPNSSNPYNLAHVGGTLFFAADDGTGGRELWKSDGTSAGTTLVKEINPSGNSYPRELTNSNGTLLFAADDGIGGRELWKSDGTSAGTVMVKEILVGGSSYPYPRFLTSVGGTLFFRADDGINGSELWKSDGTEAGTVMVKDLVAGSASSSPGALTNVSGTLFFAANDGINGRELWKSDGTEAGTVLVHDILAGSGGSGPASLTNVNGTLLMTAFDIHGTELWKSDGTEAGTTIVKDIDPRNTEGSIPTNFTEMNGLAFFDAEDSVHGNALRKSDGTQAGTVLVKDIWPGANYPSFAFLTNVNGTLFFRTNDGTNGNELWKSDGTEAGTMLVKDIRPGSLSSSPSNLTNVNGTLFFTATDDTNGTELWKTDGSEAGTVLVKDIGSGITSGAPGSLTNVNGTLFFNGGSGDSVDRELWKSDGTEAGTVKVKDIDISFGGSNPTSLTNVNGTLFFAVSSGLWKSDGSEAGTVLVKAIAASNLRNVAGSVFFAGFDATSGIELWKSDGTEAGTVLVKDIRPGAGFTPSDPINLTNVNGTLYFTANDGTHGHELWKSDGTEAGTALVSDIVVGSGTPSLTLLTSVSGTLYFTADDAVHGRELWTSDGTSAGTYMVQDINPGNIGFSVSQLANVNGTLWFSANDGVNGREPWVLRLATVDSTHLFYKGSTKWNVTNGNLPGFSDDNAIAPDKAAYLPGSGTSAFSAVSSYTKGINGLMVDLAGSHGPITASDFIFKVGNNNSPSTWATATGPTLVTTRAGAGTSGSDRVEIMWADNAIQNAWLEVIVKGNDALGDSNTNTGLQSSYVFYFGSALGDSGADDGSAFSVTPSDEISARNDPHGIGNPATIGNVNDFNRDGLVNSSDQIIARNNGTGLGNQLKFLVVGAGGPFAPMAASASPAVAGGSGMSGDDTVAFAVSLSASFSDSAPVPTPSPMAPLQSTEATIAADCTIVVQMAEDDAIDGPARFAGVGPMTEGLDLDDGLLDLLVAGRLQESLS